MIANEVILDFDREEDALRFALAAGAVLAMEEASCTPEQLLAVARYLQKAARITTNGSLTPEAGAKEELRVAS
jgi:hypothetical protein